MTRAGRGGGGHICSQACICVIIVVSNRFNLLPQLCGHVIRAFRALLNPDGCRHHVFRLNHTSPENTVFQNQQTASRPLRHSEPAFSILQLKSGRTLPAVFPPALPVGQLESIIHSFISRLANLSFIFQPGAHQGAGLHTEVQPASRGRNRDALEFIAMRFCLLSVSFALEFHISV